MSEAIRTTQRNWRVPRLPLEDWTFITLCAWGALLLGVPLIGTVAINWDKIAALFGRDAPATMVDWSIWGMLAPISPWYLGFVAGYYLYQLVPMFIANGRTRHDSVIEASIFMGILAGGTALLIALGFVIERAIYALAGWERGQPNELFYQSYNDVGWILVASLVTSLVWTTGGAMIGSAFYRSGRHGALAIGLAILVIAVTSLGDGGDTPFQFLLIDLDLNPTRSSTIVFSLLGVAMMAAVTWWNVRRVPLRNK